MPKRIIRPKEFPWTPNYDQQPWSLAVEKGDFLFISGLTGAEYDIQNQRWSCRSPSLLDQARVIFQKMKAILDAAGYSPQDVVLTVEYSLEPAMPEYRASGKLRADFFQGSMPAATGILVEGIPQDGALMVMNVVAMKGGRHKEAVFPTGTPTFERYRNLTYWPGFFVNKKWFWMSGATGRAFQPELGREVYPEGVEAQSRVAYTERLGQVMRDAGVSPQSIVKTFDYVHPACIPEYKYTGRVRREVFQGNKPASTGMVVHRMLHPSALLEVELLCYLGDDKEVIDVPEWRPRYDRLTWSPAVRAGNVVFCAGQGSVDHPTGESVGVGDLKAQVEKAYENVARVLEAAGARLSDVVRTIEFTNPQHAWNRKVLEEARRAHFTHGLPAVTEVTANQLTRTNTDFEIDVIAVVD